MDQLHSDMVVDPADFDEKSSVAIITPDADESMDDADPEPESEPRADDFEAFMKKNMPELPDQETEAEAYHTWEIRNWQNMSRREEGPVFHCAEHPWRILFFPFGNNVEFASFYLEHGFEENKIPEDWYACVQFMLVLWNPNDPTMFITHSATHRFTQDEGDWGFTRFAELRRLFASSWEERGRPMVEENNANVTAYVRVLKDPTGVLWHNFINYDSKKETGMVGLKNQGATCYLNSLLQSLYFTNLFRQAVYRIPTEQDADPRSNSAYALQRLFYHLQYSDNAVGTSELTNSFGWDTRQIFEQQDVQELSRVLMDKLDEKMKGTEVEGALGKMFVGKMKTYLSCINVDYESSRIEEFWDIQLNVSGNKNLDDSFRDYIQVETMEGENKYQAEGFGMQDARKGVIFESFPDVLHLQLKRFEYDIHRDAMMKVNDRYEFPEVWNASPYLSEQADKSEPYIYHLHGVLVHSGDLNAGHYYAFLKPTKEGHFYKFDDDRVTRATKREALEENFGGDFINVNGIGQRNPYTRTWSAKRSMSAYMLVYIRESRLDNILMTGQCLDPPKHLAERVAEEDALKERKRKEREEAHLYMEMQVASEANFKAFQGFDIVPWKPDLYADEAAQPKEYKVLKTTTVADFTATVAKDLDTEPDMIRPWAMVNRQNGTVRPDCWIQFPDMSVEEASGKFGTKSQKFRLWMEQAIRRDEDGNPVFGASLVDIKSQPNNRPLMLFLKYFDASSQKLFGAGILHASLQDKVGDLAPQILKLLGWEPGTNLKLSEEIKQNMIEAMKPKMTLQQAEIQDGDIITVQRVLSDTEVEQISATGGYIEAQAYYDYLLNRIHVNFEPKVDETLPEFSLTLSKKMTYDQLAAKVAEQLQADPTHLRFTTITNAGKAKTTVRYNPATTLASILTPTSFNYGGNTLQKTDALFYEVLDMSLKEMEQRKPQKVTWLPEGLVKEEEYTLMLPRNGTISDLLDQLQQKANISPEVISRAQVYEGHNHKFYKALPREYQIMSVHDYFQIYVADFPNEESENMITVFHFEKEPSKTHSVPFRFPLRQDEPFSETKKRLSEFTKIKGKPFEKIKFALVSKPQYHKPMYIDDDQVLWDDYISSDRDEIALGMDHVNKSRSTWGKTDSIFIR
ncbi:cysteine proteinase [Sporormia fimetaria CBS 119925]|uniref:ubiquitinyl hydrolase 1 n=1 Tax=Sporormia fimetaria CBS 119925 TaxID=1340428 RepID=A0A6A6V6F5_9PLEO|nr:cysteine proteinase [Sporormia fimetaria CBS 119925]